MRKRRKTRYTWLPNVGTTGPASDTTDDSSGRDFVITVPQNGTSTRLIVDLLEDTPQDQLTTGALVTHIANDYFIKRIVGKCFFECQQLDSSTTKSVLVTFGIFIARAGDPEVAAGDENRPIGAGVGLTDAVTKTSYNPIATECIREPWIFRRQWVLSNQLSTVADGQGGIWPPCTGRYGSIQDGPHVDAKTARRVKQDERLFAVLSTRNFAVNSVQDTDIIVTGYFDYRVLGALRKARQGSSF